MTLLSEGIENGDRPDTTTAATIESVRELESATSDDNDLDEQIKCNVIPFGLQQRASYTHGKMFSDLMGGKH